MSRLLSPAGFGLTLLLLLVPFVGVSCSDNELGNLDGSYTGYDLATGATPDYDAEGPIADMVAIEQVRFPEPGVQVLAILLIVLLVAGVAAALLPRLRVRAAAGAAGAGLAAILAVVIQLVAQSNLVSSAQELLLINMLVVPQDLTRVATEEYVADATGSRIGFWLVMIALLGVVAVNALALRAARRTVS